jgi:hypothetical protein
LSRAKFSRMVTFPWGCVMAVDGFTTQDVWFAACLAYLGYELYRVELLNGFDSAWSFCIESEDAKILLSDYTDGKLSLSDAKAFVFQFNTLARQQRDLRKRGLSSWVSDRWVRGEIE